MASVPCQTNGASNCADATVAAAALNALANGASLPDILAIMAVYQDPCKLSAVWATSVTDTDIVCGLDALVSCLIGNALTTAECTNCTNGPPAAPQAQAAAPAASAASAAPAQGASKAAGTRLGYGRGVTRRA